jgi:hypothetical protein
MKIEYITGPVFRLPPMEMLSPPRPITDAKGSLSNEQLRKIAETNQPPQSWHDGDEEQVFSTERSE